MTLLQRSPTYVVARPGAGRHCRGAQALAAGVAGLCAGARQIHPATVQPEPILTFTSGYVQRGLPLLPKQGNRKPWRLDQNYLLDVLTLRFKAVDDGVLSFDRATADMGTAPTGAASTAA